MIAHDVEDDLHPEIVRGKAVLETYGELALGPYGGTDLGRAVSLPADKLIEALRFRSEPISLSEPLREDGDAELGDVVEDRDSRNQACYGIISIKTAVVTHLTMERMLE